MLTHVARINRWLVALSVLVCALAITALSKLEVTKARELSYEVIAQSTPFPPNSKLLHTAPVLTTTHPNTYTPPFEMEYWPSGGNVLPEAQRPQKSSSSPDLNVGFIERTPAYAYDGKQKWPDPGEVVTFTARIANRGSASSGPFSYSWSIDGVVQAQSAHSGLAPNEEDGLELSWLWQYGAHTVQISLDTGNSVAEVSESNNTVEDRTDALSLGIWVEQSFYDFFNNNVFSAGWGGNSFDDWIQRHVEMWNDMFINANMLDRVRVAKIVVVPDGGVHCDTNIPANDATVDLMWGFPSEQVGVPSPAQCTWWTPRFRDDPSTWDPANDHGLIHELNHARYHIDLYGLNMYIHARPLAEDTNASAHTLRLTDPPDFVEFQPPVYFAIDGELVYCTDRSDNTFSNCSRGVEGTTPRAHNSGTPVYAATVRVLDGQGNAVVGTTALPVDSAYGASVYDEPYSGMDIMDGPTGYGEYSAYALNRIAGQRARCGNYNAPCNIGEFLDEIPLHNVLEVRWPSGQPVANASVEVYRARPFPGVWYARQYASVPDLQLVADQLGQVDLGASPFSESGDIIHGWGYSNALLLFKITTQAGIEVHFLDITAFNLAYWKGIETPIYPITLTHSVVSAFPASSLSSFPQHISSADGELPIAVQGNMSLNGNLLIAQAITNAVSIVDVGTGNLVHEPVKVGQFPNWLLATSDRVFVVNGQSDSVSILDRSTYDVLDTISVGDDPRCIVSSRGEQNGYVTNNGSRSISVINLQTVTTTNTLLLNAHPEAAIASPDGAYVYVVANTPGKVASIDSNTRQISDWFHIGRQPQAIALSPNGQYLYVVDFSGHNLYTVDAITAQIVDVLALPGLPHRIAVNPDGSKAYVANYSLNQLYVVNLANHRVVEIINVQSSQWGMDISQDGGYLFVSLYGSKEAAVIDTTSNTVVRRFVTNGNPTAVYFDQRMFNVYLPLVVTQYIR